MYRIGIQLLVLSAAAVVAQNPAQGTVLMPYSLQGNFSSDYSLVGVPSGYSACYVKFSGTITGGYWSQICRNQSSPNEVVTAVVSLTAPSVVACGQNQQLGMSYGTFGGILTGDVNSSTAAACVYFVRVDASHQTGLTRNAFANFTVYTPDFPSNGTNVACQASLPTVVSRVPLTKFGLSNFYLCQSGVCNDVPMSSYCSSGNLNSVYQIGIGMGIGGLGLLVTTIILVIVISQVVQG